MRFPRNRGNRRAGARRRDHGGPGTRPRGARARDSRAGDYARHAQRRRSRQLHARRATTRCALTTQVNLPKMKAGGLDVSFMIVYVGQSNPPQVAGRVQPPGYDRAYKAAIAKFDAIHHLTEEIAPNEIEPRADAGRCRPHREERQEGRRHRHRERLSDRHRHQPREGILRSAADATCRSRTTATASSPDSNTGEADNKWSWGGLSPLGRQVIQEMNKWGIMVDVSHPSKGAMMQAIGLVEGAGDRLAFGGPQAREHQPQSGRRDADGHQDQRRRRADRRRSPSYVKTDPAERGPAIAALRQEFALPNGRGGGAWRRPCGGTGGDAATVPGRSAASPATGAGRGGRGGRGDTAGVETLRGRSPRRVRTAAGGYRSTMAGRRPRATVKDFVDHIDYAVKLIGIDHVGISSDFDGGGGVDGWNSAAETFNVTLELVRRGYTEEQIGKIWSGNLLRVWSDVGEDCQRDSGGTALSLRAKGRPEGLHYLDADSPSMWTSSSVVHADAVDAVGLRRAFRRRAHDGSVDDVVDLCRRRRALQARWSTCRRRRASSRRRSAPSGGHPSRRRRCGASRARCRPARPRKYV